METPISEIRREYSKGKLTQCTIHDNPFEQFVEWLDDAIIHKEDEPTAMIVATVSTEGHPSTRTVLLKGVENNQFIFFTNYESRKGKQLAGNPYISLSFVWHKLERQVHIEGKAEKISPEQSDEYFATRPYTSRIGAWASEQSEVISSHKSLLAKAALIAAKHPLNVPRPPHWGGYLVIPDRIEFWQGRPSRLHDRICYLYNDGKWEIERLSP